MNQPIPEQIAQLRKAIAAQESLRPLLGDAAVEATISVLQKELALLEAQSAVEQRKQVTALFADLAGFVNMSELMDPEDVRDIMNAYFQCLTGAITYYGGVVEKFIGDAVLAVFGVPTSRESDPENAVQAGLAMQSALAKLNEDLERDKGICLSMRVGISTGPALVTFPHHENRTRLESSPVLGQGEDFTVVGDVINLASRLEKVAPVGGVLISHDTYRHIRGLFRLRILEPLRIKGKAELVPVYVVVEKTPRAFRLTSRGVEGIEAPMVGREVELQQLQQSLQTVITQRNMQVVTIIGEAGVGKSRLLYEFRSWVQLQSESVRIFKGRADQGMRRLPYSLIRDMFAFRFEIKDSDPAAVARQKLEQGLMTYMGPEGIAKAPFIGHLIGLDFSASPYLQGLLGDARQIRDRAFHYAAQFFMAIAEDVQVAIYLEDIHWADDGSLDLIDHLMRQYHHLPILIICLARPALFERFPAWGSGGSFYTRLDLNPLSKQNSRRLVEEILCRVQKIPALLHNLIVKGAEGNPFYTEELIKMLIEDGVIVKNEQDWQVQLDRLAEVRVPATLTGVLQARLDALPPVEREALQCASVVGRVFWADTVAYLRTRISSTSHAQNSHDLLLEGEAILAALQAKELIFKREPSGFATTQEYTFKQAALRDVTYNTILKRQRRSYHAQVATWLVERSSERVNEYTGLIGEHYEWAGDTATAAEWYGRAGKQAQDTYAPETAVSYYLRALALLPTDNVLPKDMLNVTRRMTLYEGLGEMLHRQARSTESVEAYKAMQTLAEQLGDAAAESRAWIGLSEVQTLHGDYRASLDSAGHAEEIARAVGRLAQTELVCVLNRKIEAYYRLGDFEAALGLGEQALALATAIDDRQELAQSLNLVGNIYNILGRHDKVEYYYEKALAFYQEVDDRWGVSTIFNNLGENARLRGDYLTSVALYQDALAIAREIGDRNGELLALNNLGGARVGLGEYEAAEVDLRQVVRMAEPINWAGLSETYRFLAEACLGQGNFEEALTAAQQALVLAREVEEQELLGAAWRALGKVAAGLRRPVRLDIWGIGGSFLEYEAAACFAESWHIFVETRMEAEQAHTLRAWSCYEQDQGNLAQSEEMWQEARQIFSRLGMVLEVERMDEEKDEG